MFNVFPSAIIYTEYLSSIHKYNQWFIKLRYYAVVSLILLFFGLELFFDFDLNSLQIAAQIIIILVIAIYNLIFSKFSSSYDNSKNDITPLRISFYQMTLDILSLSVLVYFLGGIEAPIFMFYIFHMIIGSLLLPISIMFFMAGSIVFFFSLFSILEYLAIIPHQSVAGLYHNPVYNDIHFVVGFLFIFAMSLFISIILTNKIVTELYARERHLKNALEQLNQAEESKQKYIMAVVHDLKSPIAASISLLDLVLGGFVGKYDESVKEKISKAKVRSEESIENINEILHISKFKLMNKLSRKDFSFLELVQNNIDLVKQIADNKNTRLSLMKNVNDKYLMNGDPVLLNLVLSNLISNSVKYTPPDGTVNIILNENDSTISLEVIDNGIGIPKVDQEKIFDEFYRASNVMDKKIEGTGTGLSAVKQIIMMHNGNIRLESPSQIGTEDRPGTSFIISIPTNT